MKRDMDLIRTILLAIEECQQTQGTMTLSIPDQDPESVSYHVKLLAQAGLIDANDLSSSRGFAWKPRSLTWAGHEFLDAAPERYHLEQGEAEAQRPSRHSSLRSPKGTRHRRLQRNIRRELNDTNQRAEAVPSDSFSRRHGFQDDNPPITIWKDAPEEFRHAILVTARDEGGLDPHALREIVCKVLRKRPDPSNWSAYPNVWGEVEWLIEKCPWYRVYDIVEEIYNQLPHSLHRSRGHKSEKQAEFDIEISQLMAEFGIGWKLEDGLVTARGEDSFEAYLESAEEAVEEAGKPTALTELKEAIRDLSRRPEPDTSGAIQHAMAALECVARDVSDDPKPTLGKLIQQNPELFPPPVDKAVEKLWGYASENARHGREGNDPTREEAMLVVGISATLVNYLMHKFLADDE